MPVPGVRHRPSLVPRGCEFANPLAYGINDCGTEGKMAVGARAIPVVLRMRFTNNLSQLQLVMLVDGRQHPLFRFHFSIPLGFVLAQRPG